MFMTHPDHGANNVPDHEITAHEAHGWKVDTFENWMARKPVKKVDTEPDPAVAEEPEIASKPVYSPAPHKSTGRKRKGRTEDGLNISTLGTI